MTFGRGEWSVVLGRDGRAAAPYNSEIFADLNQVSSDKPTEVLVRIGPRHRRRAAQP